MEMWRGVDRATHEFASAMLDVISEAGVDRVTLERAGGRLGLSRSSMYREYETLSVLLVRAHEAALEWVSHGFGRIRVGTPRMQVEDVFAELRAFARTPRGQALRALRSRVASLGDLEDFRRREAEGLVTVRQWLETLVDRPHSRPDLVTDLTATLWAHVLGHGARDPGPPTTAELERTWQLLSAHFAVTEAPRAPVDAELHLACLGELLTA